MISINYDIFYGDISHDVSEKCYFSQTENTAKKHPIYEDKSDTRRKVVKVRRTLI